MIGKVYILGAIVMMIKPPERVEQLLSSPLPSAQLVMRRMTSHEHRNHPDEAESKPSGHTTF